MSTHISEPTLLYSIAVLQRKQNVENTDSDHRLVARSTTAIPPERRCESRMDYRWMCSYEMVDALEKESFVIEQGEALALNRSTEGTLLFMCRAPHVKQLIEVHSSRSGWGRTVTIFETRWAKPVPVESQGNLYLVGCRRIFGPCHYLSF